MSSFMTGSPSTDFSRAHWCGALRSTLKGAAVFGTRQRLLRRVTKKRFVVTPKAGPTFTGLLIDVDASCFHFADVSVLDQGVERPAQGDVYIDRANVAYMQKHMG
jgi:hypothetical protein